MIVPAQGRPAPVLGLYAAPHAQAFYRLAVPLLSAYGEQAAVRPWPATAEQLDAAKVVVLSKLIPSGQSEADGRGLVRALQEGGRRRVLVDLDDDLNPPTATPSSWTRAKRAAVEAMLRAADGIIVTNPTLAGRLRPYGTPVRVVPNYVRPDLWPELPPRTDDGGPTWLLLAGGVSHEQDWRIVLPALTALRGRYRLRVVGHLPAYLAPLCDDHRAWSALDAYPANLAGCAVALCPLPDSRFNRAKSPVKLYEATLAGCAVVGSECQYGPELRDAGLPYAVAGDWAHIIGYYLARPDARQYDAAALRRHIATLDARLHVKAICAAYAA